MSTSAIGQVLDLLMFASLCLLILTGIPVVFLLTGCAIVFGALGIAFGVFDTFLLGALAQRIFGTMTSETLVAIPLFVFMGIMLERRASPRNCSRRWAGCSARCAAGSRSASRSSARCSRPPPASSARRS
jgi:hypothetical protein